MSASKKADKRRASLARPNTIRLREVAELAGVSTATVSRVLNNAGTVSGELRSRIESAVSELAYVPHWAAKTLASQRSRTIGAVVPTLDIAIFATGVEALQDRLHEHGYTLLLASYQYNLGREKELVRSLIERGVDSIVLVGNTHDEAIFRMAAKAHVQLVNTYSYDENSEHPCIGFDNRKAAGRVASFLHNIGHREFGLITSPLLGNDRISARLDGMLAALGETGISLPESAIVETQYSIDDGRRAFRELIRRRPQITAVACTTDAHAIGSILEAARMKIDVPGRLSITGFDDLALASQLTPALTTVHVPARDLGRRTADFIVGAIQGKVGPSAIDLPVDLVLRSSHSPPSRAAG